MAETSPYRPVPELDLSGAAHVVAERWRRWKRSFDLYVAGQNIDDSTRKHSLLLHFAGMNTQDLFETLAEPADPEDRYEKTVAMLDGQFKVAKNTPFERHVFRQMVPQPNEPVDKFVARLRQQARLCDFSDLNDQLRDQLVDKVAQPGLRRKLLEKDNISLDDALKICRSWEATAHQAAQMTSSATPGTTAEVHAIAHSPQTRRNRNRNRPWTPPHRESDEPECPNCGFQGHMAGDSCPARGRTCHKCGKKNHFSRKCHSNNRTDSTQHERIQPRQGRAHHVADVREDLAMEDSDYETVFTVGQPTAPSPRVHLRIGNSTWTSAIIDSGASCNLLGTDRLSTLRQSGLKVTLDESRQPLYAYGSTQPLKLAGQFSAPTTINGKTSTTTFVVIDGPGEILLGRTSSVQFDTIHFATDLAQTYCVTNDDEPQTRLTKKRFITKTAVPNALKAQQLESSKINPERCQIRTNGKRDSPPHAARLRQEEHMHIRDARIAPPRVSEGGSPTTMQISFSKKRRGRRRERRKNKNKTPLKPEAETTTEATQPRAGTPTQPEPTPRQNSQKSIAPEPVRFNSKTT